MNIVRKLAALALATLTGCSSLPDRSAAELACSAAPAAGPVHPRHAALDGWLDRAVDAGLPGVVLQVNDPTGAYAGARGHADIESGAELAACNRLRVGSVSKMLTAVTALRLVDEGALDLDATLDRLLPGEISEGLPNRERITLRHVIGQQSGLPDYLRNMSFQTATFDDPGASPTMADALGFVRGASASFEPGQRFEYSNTNYVVLGLILEHATGDLERAFRSRLFEPLAMSGSSFDVTGADPADVVTGYFDLYGSGPVVDARSFGVGKATPDAGIVSTAGDLGVLLDALFRGDLLKPETLASMQAWAPDPEATDDRTGYGLGLFHLEPKGLPAGAGHSGIMFGYTAEVYHFPERDLSLVVLVNGGFGRLEDAFRRLELDDLLPLLLEE